MRRLEIDNPFGGECWWVDETDSTMRIAKEIAEAGATSGSFVVAGRQSAGRGRVDGRTWRDEAGKSLLFTIALDRERCPPAALPLRVGLALARACAKATHRPLDDFAIKWPNDLLFAVAPARAKKLAGILCEGDPRGFRIGIGINCLQEFFPEELAAKAGSLYIATGARVQPLDLLPILLAEMRAAFAEEGWKEALESLLWERGEHVRFLAGHPDHAECVEGVLVGIGEGGELLIDDGSAVRALHSGELVVNLGKE